MSTIPWRRIGEWRYSSTHSLTSALDEGDWSASRLGRFTTRERARGTHWIGGWEGPRAVLDAVVKRKIRSPRWESNPKNPDRPVRSPALYRLSYHGSAQTKSHKAYQNIPSALTNISHLCWVTMVSNNVRKHTSGDKLKLFVVLLHKKSWIPLQTKEAIFAK
jgi:hypothetical protein